MASSTIAPLIIQPSRGWSKLGLHELWEYRDLLWLMAWRDLKARYRQTALGPLWIILQPIMSMVLYTLIFGEIANLPSEGKPYAVFSYAALLPWGFFANAYNNGVAGIAGGLGLSSKVYFPRLIVPLSRIVSHLVDTGMSFVILLGMLLYFGIQPNWGVLVLPLLLALAALTGFGVGLWFSGLVVKFRDVGQLTSFLLRAWMYATPVVYSIEIIPAEWRAIYRLNPMTGVIEGFRWALLNTAEPPTWWLVAVSGLVSAVVLLAGLYIFKRVERIIVDVA